MQGRSSVVYSELGLRPKLTGHEESIAVIPFMKGELIVADYKEEFKLPFPPSEVPTTIDVVCNRVRNELRWKVEKQDGSQVVIEKPGTLMEKAVKITLKFDAVSDRESLLSIIGSMTGFGPIVVAHIKKRVEEVKRIVAAQTLPKIEEVEFKQKVEAGTACPTCGNSMAPGTRFCPNDGTPISKVCKQCNHTNSPLSQFCSNCGAALQ